MVDASRTAAAHFLLLGLVFTLPACLKGQVSRRSSNTSSPSKVRNSTQVVSSTRGKASKASRTAELPREYVNTTWIPSTGRILQVRAGENLQSVLDNARPGDEVVLPAGQSFRGSFLLPNKPGDGWITVRSSALDRLTEGKRVKPSDATLMPKIIAPRDLPAFRTENGSARWRLAGLEVTVDPSVRLNYAIISLGDGQETTFDLLTSDITLDRMYIHGAPQCQCRRGVAMHGARQAVIDSYISEVHVQGQDSQGIAGWNGPGPFKIVNNYLEAAGENILFGGSDPMLVFRMTVKEGATTTRATLVDVPPFSAGTPIMFTVGGKTGQHAYTVLREVTESEVTFDELSAPPDANSTATVGVVPSDLEIRRNTFFKPLTWKADDPSFAGARWSVKNLFELKSAQRVLVDGNWMENSWVDAQAGTGVLLTSTNQDGGCPYCVTQDVTFSNNVVKNTLQGLVLIGHQSSAGAMSQPATIQRVNVYNNLFYPTSRLFSFFHQAGYVTVENNTGFSTNVTLVAVPQEEGLLPGYQFRGNILERAVYGVGGEGNAFLTSYFPDFVWDKNALVNSSGGTDQERSNDFLKNAYPPGTLVVSSRSGVRFVDLAGADKDYRGLALAANSPLKNNGLNGKDHGVDFTELSSKLPSPIF